MFRTAKHVLAAAVVIAITAAPSIALADPPQSSGAAPTISEITVIKTVNVPTPKLRQTSVTGTHVAPAQ